MTLLKPVIAFGVGLWLGLWGGAAAYRDATAKLRDSTAKLAEATVSIDTAVRVYKAAHSEKADAITAWDEASGVFDAAREILAASRAVCAGPEETPDPWTPEVEQEDTPDPSSPEAEPKERTMPDLPVDQLAPPWQRRTKVAEAR